jgi:hypothetical protein
VPGERRKGVLAMLSRFGVAILMGALLGAPAWAGSRAAPSGHTVVAALPDTARAGVVDETDADEALPAEPVTGVSRLGLRVLRAYVCKGIDESEPTEAGKSFVPAPEGTLELCLFSEIGASVRPDTIFHVWYWGEREMARIPLAVNGERWRTWSVKRIVDAWRGEWHVDIADREGTVLARLPFSVE